jgi:hypothetical protein
VEFSIQKNKNIRSNPAKIDLSFRVHLLFCFSGKGSNLGIVPILEENPNPSSLSSARSFLKKFKNSKILFVHPEKGNDQILSPLQRVVGAGQLL